MARRIEKSTGSGTDPTTLNPEAEGANLAEDVVAAGANWRLQQQNQFVSVRLQQEMVQSMAALTPGADLSTR